MKEIFKEGDIIIIDRFSSNKDGCPGEWEIDEILNDFEGEPFEAFIKNKSGDFRIEYIHCFKKVKNKI